MRNDFIYMCARERTLAQALRVPSRASHMIILCTERFITSDLLKVVPSQSAIYENDVSVLYLFRSWYDEMRLLLRDWFQLGTGFQLILMPKLIFLTSMNKPETVQLKNGFHTKSN